MFNWLQNLRLQQIFGPAQTDPTFAGSYNPEMTDTFRTPQPEQPMEPDYDAGARMAELYRPETKSIDAFNQLAGAYPERENPGMLKKIAAIGLGSLADYTRGSGAGKAGFNEMMGYGKFDRDLANWKNKMEPLETAAANERLTNNQNRQYAQTTVTNELKQRKDEKTAQLNDEKLAISQQRANVYEFKARNPGVKFDFSSPYVMSTNPLTGKVEKVLGPDGKPIETGKMSEKDKIDLNQGNALDRIGAQGNNQINLQGVRHDDRLEEIEASGEQARNTRATPTGNSVNSGTRPETATQTRVRQFNTARELYNSDPTMRPYIRLGKPGSNDFEIVAPNPNGWTARSRGPEQTLYDSIVNSIYGDQPPAVQTTRVAPPNTSGRTGGPGPNTGAPKVDANKVTTDNAARRQAAIAELQKAGKPVTAANIDYVLKNMR